MILLRTFEERATKQFRYTEINLNLSETMFYQNFELENRQFSLLLMLLLGDLMLKMLNTWSIMTIQIHLKITFIESVRSIENIHRKMFINCLVFDTVLFIFLILINLGRTGRCQQAGTAYTFFTPGNGRQARELIAVMLEGSQTPPQALMDLAGKNFYVNKSMYFWKAPKVSL